MEPPARPFDIFPALHLTGGRPVDLAPDETGPDGAVDADSDPVATARRWIERGARWLHVIDVDSVFDRDGSANRAVVERLCELPVSVQAGGGVRTAEDVAWAMRAGVDRVMLSTAAVESPDVVANAVIEHGRARFALSVRTDERGDIVTHGQHAVAGMQAAALAVQMAALGIRTAVHARVAPDGTMTGTDLETSRELASLSGMDVIVGGEVRDMDDVVDCYNRPGITGVLIGKALQTGRIDLGVALDETRATLAFESGLPRWRAEELTLAVRLRRTLARANLLRHLPPAAGLRVLDAGGGNGAASLHLAAAGADVDVVDRSVSMRGELDASAAREGVAHRITTHAADIREIDQRFEPDAFDAVICHNVIQYSPDWERLLTSMTAPLKSGGTLSLVVRNWYAEPYGIDVEAHAADELPALMELARGPSRVFDADVLLFSAPYLAQWLDESRLRRARRLRAAVPPRRARGRGTGRARGAARAARGARIGDGRARAVQVHRALRAAGGDEAPRRRLARARRARHPHPTSRDGVERYRHAVEVTPAEHRLGREPAPLEPRPREARERGRVGPVRRRHDRLAAPLVERAERAAQQRAVHAAPAVRRRHPRLEQVGDARRQLEPDAAKAAPAGVPARGHRPRGQEVVADRTGLGVERGEAAHPTRPRRVDQLAVHAQHAGRDGARQRGRVELAAIGPAVGRGGPGAGASHQHARHVQRHDASDAAVQRPRDPAHGEPVGSARTAAPAEPCRTGAVPPTVNRPPDTAPTPRAPPRVPARSATVRAAAALAAALLTGPSGAAPERTPLTYRTPPAIGDAVAGQPSMLVCDGPAPARSAARTGFVAGGCRHVGDETGWRVVGLEHERIEDGGLWLVRVERAGTPGWIPLPWHDWA